MRYWKIGITGDVAESGLERRYLRFWHDSHAKRVLQLQMVHRISMQGQCHGCCHSGESIRAAPHACGEA